MNDWIEKPWGKFRVIHGCDPIQVVEATAYSGGKCSVHLHRKKSNQFTVLEGVLLVDVRRFRAWEPDGAYEHRRHILMPGDTLDVDACEAHQFTALGEVKFLEVYKAISIPLDGKSIVSDSDIVRFLDFITVAQEMKSQCPK